MSGGTIYVTPPALQHGAPVTAKSAGTSDNLTNTLMHALNTFIGEVSPLAGEAIIGPGATALMEALDQAGAGLESALGCFGTGLKIMAPAMAQTAQAYLSLDSSLASTFHELDSVLPLVEQFATPITLTTPTPGEIATLNHYIATVKQGKIPQIPATLASLNITMPSTHRGFWGTIGHGIAQGWDDTGGKAVSWIGNHGWVIGAGALTVLTLAVGAIVNIPDGETGEVAIAAGDTAMLDAAASADATAATAATAATTTTVTDSGLLTYADFLAETAGTGAPADIVSSLSPAELAQLEALTSVG